MTVQPLVFFNQIAIDANTQKIEIIEESFRKLFAVLMSKKQLTNLTEKFENHRIDYTSNTNETILSINWFQNKQYEFRCNRTTSKIEHKFCGQSELALLSNNAYEESFCGKMNKHLDKLYEILLLVTENNNDVSTDTKNETPIEIKSDSKSETPVEVKVESKNETQVEIKSDTKNETPIEIKSDSELEIKVESKTETAVENKSESKNETSVEIKVESKTETPVEIKVDSKAETSVTVVYDPDKLYFDEFEETITIKHIECNIPQLYRKITRKYGSGYKGGLTRRAFRADKANVAVVFRKNKKTSVLRNMRVDNGLILKIGTGDLFTTKGENFECRVHYSEKTLQNIKAAFIEFVKWIESKQEDFKKEEEKEIEEKRKEEEKRLEEERKKEEKRLEEERNKEEKRLEKERKKKETEETLKKFFASSNLKELK